MLIVGLLHIVVEGTRVSYQCHPLAPNALAGCFCVLV
jgi:hypothetical protein